MLLQIWDFLRLFCKTCPNTLCFCKYLLEDPCHNKGYNNDRLQRMHLLSVVKSQVGCYRCVTLYINVNLRLVLIFIMYDYVFMYSTYQHEHTLVYFHSYFSGGIGSLLLKNLRFRDVYYPQEATGSSEHRSTNNLNDDLRWLSALHNIPEYQRQYASEKLHHHSSGGLLLHS